MSASVFLRKNEDGRLLDGHLWAFSNEIKEVRGGPAAGDIVELRAHNGTFIGRGFYNPGSLIAVRLLTRGEEAIDFAFFRSRIERALDLRKMLYPDDETFRLVHGESDLLPGLIIDKYGDIFSVQTLSYGMDRRLTLICDVLDSLFHPTGIIERNESHLRILEGLEQTTGVLRGKNHPVVFSEYDISYTVDVLNGQKTGFFLDQRENRKAFRRYAGGKTVLDCFCNEGGFALNAAYAKADHVTAVDSSEPALAAARENGRRNGLSRVDYTLGDVFEVLRRSAPASYDVVNLDPPSFARSRKDVTAARRALRELHGLALTALKPGGILTTSTCSHHLLEATLIETVVKAAASAGKTTHLLERRGAAPDHPILPTMPETSYLKFAVFHIV
jgi:23S rRNA (cytosine1962-C5)-methyltransferase